MIELWRQRLGRALEREGTAEACHKTRIAETRATPVGFSCAFFVAPRCKSSGKTFAKRVKIWRMPPDDICCAV